MNDFFDGFDPEDRRHLQSLSIRRSSRGLTQQEGDIVDAPSEEWRKRDRGNYDRDRVGDLLFADGIAEHRIRIVQHSLRDSASSDKAA
jgi:hypothetical protein